jgi:hypothetical protein
MTHAYDNKKTPKDAANVSKDVSAPRRSSPSGSPTGIPLRASLAYGNEVPPALQLSAEPVQRKANTTGLSDTLKTGIENLSGLSMDDVQVHYNSLKPAQVQALAYTQGTGIHVGPGQERHLAREAWHVVQQKEAHYKRKPPWESSSLSSGIKPYPSDQISYENQILPEPLSHLWGQCDLVAKCFKLPGRALRLSCCIQVLGIISAKITVRLTCS